MSRIDDLIADACPDGVEHKTLGEVGVLIRGRRFTKADYVEEGLGSIHYGEIYTDYGAWATEVRKFVRPELKGSLRLAEKGDLVIAATGENVKDVCKAVAWLGSEEIAVHDDCYIFRHDLDPKYVSYFFQAGAFEQQKTKFATESKLARISGANLGKIRMPVPSPAIQREIVAILDKMETLKAELEAELEYRSLQYAHYRGSLLTFAESERARWATLSELFDMRAGKFVAASEISSSRDAAHPYPCFGGGGLRGYVGESSHKGEHVLVGRQGALCGNVKRAQGEFYATEHAVVVTARAEVDIRWAFHMLTAMDLNQYASKSAQPGLAVGTIEKLRVPVPTYREQQRVGGILDKFDALVNDLSIGLPAEIAARRRQYEYYRDKLLTFEEAA